MQEWIEVDGCSCEQASVSFINKVYGLMTLGLFLTAGTSYYAVHNINPDILVKMVMPCFWGELIMVLAMSFFIRKMSGLVATLCFAAYAIVNGLFLSLILLAYAHTTVTSAFAITGCTFGAMCLVGTVTRKDLTSLGMLAFMLLIGVVIASLVNFFLKNPMVDYVLSFISVFIFTGLTAYDAQKIKLLAASGETRTNIAIMGALQLYLDFINMFLSILRVMSKKK